VGVLSILAGLVLFATAALQAADALGRAEFGSYPFVKSKSVAVKWVYVGWLIFVGIAAVAIGLRTWPI
jgi:hypothetical protein